MTAGHNALRGSDSDHPIKRRGKLGRPDLRIALYHAGAGRKCRRHLRTGLGHGQFGLPDPDSRGGGESHEMASAMPGRLDIDATGDFNFDSPRQLTS
jgi:hypothetical protein